MVGAAQTLKELTLLAFLATQTVLSAVAFGTTTHEITHHHQNNTLIKGICVDLDTNHTAIAYADWKESTTTEQVKKSNFGGRKAARREVQAYFTDGFATATWLAISIAANLAVVKKWRQNKR